MFEELDELKAHLDTLRPIDADKMMAVQEKLRIDWTYNTNAIEGNTLTLQETAFFLREGLTSKGKPLSEFLEAKNHVEAISFLEEVVKENRPLTERLIKDFHAIVMQDSKYVWIGPPDNRVKKRIEPGNYKYDNNHVVKLDGTIHFYTDHLQVPGEMEKLIKWYEENKEIMHPVELAAGLHHKFVAIHPFTDGNGRVARLVMNLVLMQAGYLPAIIKNEDRMEYYSALDAADKGDYAPFIQIVERETHRTMKMVVDVIEGREAFGKEDLKRMMKGFSEKIKKLDKDIGIISKEVDDNVRMENIENIRSLFEQIARHIISEAATDEMVFAIVPSFMSKNVTVSHITYYCIKNKIKCAWWKKESRYDEGTFDDRTKNGCGLGINLSSNRMYVPPANLHFFIIPTKYKCIIVAQIGVSGFENDSNLMRPSKFKENYTEVGNVWGDYDKSVIENFFINTFKAFIKAIEEEVESRRRLTEENASE